MLVSSVICYAFSWNLFFGVYPEYLVNIASGYVIIRSQWVNQVYNNTPVYNNISNI